MYQCLRLRRVNYPNLKQEIRSGRVSLLSIQIGQLIRSIHKAVLLRSQINMELAWKVTAPAKCLRIFRTNMELGLYGYRRCTWTCGKEDHLNLKLYRRARRLRPHKQSAADKASGTVFKRNQLWTMFLLSRAKLNALNLNHPPNLIPIVPVCEDWHTQSLRWTQLGLA